MYIIAVYCEYNNQTPFTSYTCYVSETKKQAERKMKMIRDEFRFCFENEFADTIVDSIQKHGDNMIVKWHSDKEHIRAVETYYIERL